MSAIQKLDEVISPYIEKDKNVVETKITDLTAPGDNFGSHIYKVDLKLKTKEDEIEELYLAAKQIPDSEYYQHVFNIQVTFNQEKEFYKTIVPTLHEFQRKMGVELLETFPKFFGARNNLNYENGKVDKDGLIVFENLKVKGYKNLDRFVGFDMQTSKLILKTMAQFHAVPLALKLKEPKVFEEKIKPFLSCFLPHGPKLELKDEIRELVKVLEKSEECKPLAPALEKSFDNFAEFPKHFGEPFSTLVHRDFWVNNIMINFENNQAKDVKLVDFQLYSYDTPASDLFFFLFTSVQTDILKQNLDYFIKYYYQNLIKNLIEHKCQTDEFSYDKFLDEMTTCSKFVFCKTIFLLIFIVRGPKEGQNDINNPKLNANHLRPEDIDRFYWIVQECHKRGWLNF